MKKLIISGLLFFTNNFALFSFQQTIINNTGTELTFNATMKHGGARVESGTIVDTLAPGQSRTIGNPFAGPGGEGIVRLYVLLPRIMVSATDTSGLSRTITVPRPSANNTFIITHKGGKLTFLPGYNNQLKPFIAGGTIDIEIQTK